MKDFGYLSSIKKEKKKKEEYTYFPHAFGGREVVQDLELGENHLL